jgi:hypothetical protein
VNTVAERFFSAKAWPNDFRDSAPASTAAVLPYLSQSNQLIRLHQSPKTYEPSTDTDPRCTNFGPSATLSVNKKLHHEIMSQRTQKCSHGRHTGHDQLPVGRLIPRIYLLYGVGVVLAGGFVPFFKLVS